MSIQTNVKTHNFEVQMKVYCNDRPQSEQKDHIKCRLWSKFIFFNNNFYQKPSNKLVCVDGF